MASQSARGPIHHAPSQSVQSSLLTSPPIVASAPITASSSIVVRSPVISPFTSTVPSITNTSPSTIPSITTSPWMTKTPSSTVSPSATVTSPEMTTIGSSSSVVSCARAHPAARAEAQRDEQEKGAKRAHRSVGVFHRRCDQRVPPASSGGSTSMPGSAKNWGLPPVSRRIATPQRQAIRAMRRVETRICKRVPSVIRRNPRHCLPCRRSWVRIRSAALLCAPDGSRQARMVARSAMRMRVVAQLAER